MKRYLLAIAALCGFGVSYGQISADIVPYTSKNDHLAFERTIHRIELPGLDMNRINQEDTDGRGGDLYKIGRTLPIGISLETGGTWTDVPGGKLWRLEVTSAGAKALSFMYDDFFIPEGAIMHVYNPDKSEVLGAFTSLNNKDFGTFSTGLVKGESSIIEYFEPDHIAGQGRISVDKVSHVYRGLELMETQETERGGSDPCQVDVRCEEGDDWAGQIDAVVRIYVVDGGNVGWCSGAVMNNTNEDCLPYVLTAFHCGDGASGSDFNQWIFYFRRQKNGCGTGAVEGTQSITGCTRRSHSNDGGGNFGSDYLLVELSQQIPAGYSAYYAGWNVSTVAATDGVSIHHPSGDVKKISTYTSTLTSVSWGGSVAGTHWRVYWVATANGHGVTEGGSSGSPIYNTNGRVVGQLTGGSSYCNEVVPGGQNQPDAYGKMSYNWDQNSNPIGGDLKNWLDPANLGVEDFGGTYSPCINSIEETVLTEKTLMYPNPTSGQFTIALTHQTLEDLRVTVYNGLGAKVTDFEMGGQFTGIVDLSGQAAGMYYVHLRSGDALVTKKINLIK